MLDFMGDEQGIPQLFRERAKLHGEGWYVPAGTPFDAAGFGVQSQEDQAWVNRRLTAHPLAAFDDPLVLTGAWESIRTRAYIRCEQFQIAHGEPLIRRLESDPGWRTERWDCHHSPHITRPDRVVNAILSLEA
jgi:hypothetical protein